MLATLERLTLREEARLGSAKTGRPRVDREAGIIYGVRVLGPKSANRRRYTEGAMRSALPLYEGAVVNVHHPRDRKNPDQARDIDDRFGSLRNVRFHNGGIHADLHVFKSHRLAGVVFDAAESAPHTMGLSHNADGHGRTENGETIVEEIYEVRSVDLVTNPATTFGLFESVDTPLPDGVSAEDYERLRRILLRDGTSPEAIKAAHEAYWQELLASDLKSVEVANENVLAHKVCEWLIQHPEETESADPVQESRQRNRRALALNRGGGHLLESYADRRRRFLERVEYPATPAEFARALR